MHYTESILTMHHYYIVYGTLGDRVFQNSLRYQIKHFFFFCLCYKILSIISLYIKRGDNIHLYDLNI